MPQQRTPAPLPPEAPDLHAWLFETADKILRTRGEMNVVGFVVLESGGVVPVDPPGLDDESKDRFVHTLRMMSLALETRCIAVMSESWIVISEGPNDDIMSVRPSQSERRREIVFISCEWNETASMWVYEIERNQDSSFKSLAEAPEFVGSNGEPQFIEGRFANLLAPKGVPADVRDMARKGFGDSLNDIFEAEAALSRSNGMQ